MKAMAYSDHFALTDDLIAHLDTVIAGIQDPFIESRYTGFVAVSAVTVLELSLKTIFCDFADKKNRVLGRFCAKHFERINGRIALKEIREAYLPRFGSPYDSRFVQKLELAEKSHLKAHGASIKASYSSLVTWRHGFAHEGTLPSNATYVEVKRAYECGKEVMRCLAASMTR